MAYYDYECRECGKSFEVRQSFEEHDRGEDHESHEKLKCPHCGSKKIEQLLTPSVFAITKKKS